MKHLTKIFLLLVAFILLSGGGFAQDPTKVDSSHYKVVFENEKVRVLRITYGAGEKSVMHKHPDAVVVMLTDSKTEFTLPDGEVIELSGEQGDASWTPEGEHLPQNVGEEPMEAILVELK
jgi:quercetin dioxygenase-like cupin family protein